MNETATNNQVSTNNETSSKRRAFAIVAIGAGMVSWDIGFQAGAFDMFSYERAFKVFVISTILLVASFVPGSDRMLKSTFARISLMVPLAYVIAELLLWTQYSWITLSLLIATVALFPYNLYLLARIFGGNYFDLDRDHKILATLLTLLFALTGYVIGSHHERFVSCDDFQRNGDYTPTNCNENYKTVIPRIFRPSN